MHPATLKRHERGLRALNLEVSPETWRRIKLAALSCSPPMLQGDYLRAVLARCEPIVADPAAADHPGEA